MTPTSTCSMGKRFENKKLRPGLPDGVFLYQNIQFGYNLVGLGFENLGIFYGCLEYFMAFWYTTSRVIWYMAILYTLWSFNIFLPHFRYVVPIKIWQPGLRPSFD
jgi:hypothetical protein